MMLVEGDNRLVLDKVNLRKPIRHSLAGMVETVGQTNQERTESSTDTDFREERQRRKCGKGWGFLWDLVTERLLLT